MTDEETVNANDPDEDVAEDDSGLAGEVLEPEEPEEAPD